MTDTGTGSCCDSCDDDHDWTQYMIVQLRTGKSLELQMQDRCVYRITAREDVSFTRDHYYYYYDQDNDC
jgi:hypothetical protein